MAWWIHSHLNTPDLPKGIEGLRAACNAAQAELWGICADLTRREVKKNPDFFWQLDAQEVSVDAACELGAVRYLALRLVLRVAAAAAAAGCDAAVAASTGAAAAAAAGEAAAAAATAAFTGAAAGGRRAITTPPAEAIKSLQKACDAAHLELRSRSDDLAVLKEKILPLSPWQEARKDLEYLRGVWEASCDTIAMRYMAVRLALRAAAAQSAVGHEAGEDDSLAAAVASAADAAAAAATRVSVAAVESVTAANKVAAVVADVATTVNSYRGQYGCHC